MRKCINTQYQYRSLLLSLFLKSVTVKARHKYLKSEIQSVSLEARIRLSGAVMATHTDFVFFFIHRNASVSAVLHIITWLLFSTLALQSTTSILVYVRTHHAPEARMISLKSHSC